MPLQLPCRLCAEVADCVVGSPSLQAAYDAIRAQFFNTLLTELIIFVKKDTGWTRVAGRVDVNREQAWRRAVDGLPMGAPAVVRIGEGGERATAIAVPDLQPVAIVIDDDWTSSEDVLIACASVIAAGLRVIRAREAAHRVDGLLRHGYRFTKAIADPTTIDALARRIVDGVAQMYGAERVSLALYDREEDCLKIAATVGIPMAVVDELKIRPGEWVIGRVYETAKILTVNDVRVLPGSQAHRRRYRSHSFAAAPLFSGGNIVGVLSLTERRDGVPFSNVDRIALRAIGALAGAALFAVQTRIEIERVRHAASVDSITGLLNRAYLDTRLHQEVGRSQRENTELAVLIADVDDFKSINDSRGHPMGDAVLKEVGEIIRSAVRVFDVCARYGGDEFAILMPNSDRASALACAERIRQRTADYRKHEDPAFPRLTVSVGVAVGGATKDAAELIRRADAALYEAKASGKNTVRSGTPDGSEQPSSAAVPIEPPTRSGAVAGDEGPARVVRLPYVLVADTDVERRKIYSQAAETHRLGLLVASDEGQAMRLIEQFGPPVLLALDMTGPELNGLVPGSLLLRHRSMVIVAISQARELRAYAGATPDAQLHVLRPSAKPAMVAAVVARALATRGVSSEAESFGVGQRTRRTMRELAVRASQAVDTAGVAVYLKDPVSGLMRGAVTWESEAALGRAQHFLPRVVDRVLQDGELVMLGDVRSTSSLGDAIGPPADGTHGLVAAPVRDHGNVVGVVCGFADAPLQLSEAALTEFTQVAASGYDPGTSQSEEAPTEHELVAPQATAPATHATDHVVPQASVSSTVSSPVAPHPDARARTAQRPDDPSWEPTLLERPRGEFEVARELARLRREQRHLSVVLFDVSNRTRPREYDDNRASAESALQRVAETFVRAVRQSDLPIRWSGNELLLVLPGLAGVEARAVAERVRAAMEAGGERRVAVSGGVAELDRDEQFGAMVNRARAKVALAVDSGHNRVS